MLPFGDTGYMGSLYYFLELHVNGYLRTKCLISSNKKIIKYNNHLNSLEITGALSTGSCNRPNKRGCEELPRGQGQGQKPGGPHAWRVAAKRSYPMSKVRGSGWEYQTATAQE